MTRRIIASSSGLAVDSDLRMDAKYHLFMSRYNNNVFEVNNKELINLGEILIPDYTNFDYEDDKVYKGIPTSQEYLDEDGQITSYQEVTKNEHPSRIKYKATEDNILLSSLKGAKTPALNFDMDLSEYVFSNGYNIFKVNKDWNKKFVMYILRHPRLKYILDNHIYRGIGISSYKERDLFALTIPAVPKERQDEVVDEIKIIEQEINDIKAKLKPYKNILDNILADEYSINWDEIRKLEGSRRFYFSLRSIAVNSVDLRNSYKWNKLEIMLDELYHANNYVALLGDFIIETNNGWSPSCDENPDGTAVLGINAIADGRIEFDNCKYTSQSINNMDKYYVHEGDFFVSRGNTVDLVALAGTVTAEPERNTIYPDLMIKVKFDEQYIDPRYAAIIFNSSIGRIYFKYAAKGKNISMVKISSQELRNMKLPVPPLNVQKQVIEKVAELIKSQDRVKESLKLKREKINDIIFKVLTE